MMKRIQKLVSVIIAFALATCMVPLAFAENSSSATDTSYSTGTIEILNAQADVNYQLYRIFDVTSVEIDSNGDDASQSNYKYAYTLNTDHGWQYFFFGDESTENNTDTPAGAKYIEEYSDYSNEPSAASSDYIYTFNYTDSEGTKSYILKVDDTNVTEFAQDALDFALNSDKITPSSNGGSPSSSGNWRITGLKLGYYLVYPYGASQYTNTGGSVCNLLTNAPYQSIEVKSGYPTISKEVSSIEGPLGNLVDNAGDGTVCVGDTVEFKITGKVPDPTGFSNYIYTIADSMSTGLNFQAGSVKIQINGNKQEDKAKNFSSSCWTIKENGTEGFSVEFNIPQMIKESPSVYDDEIVITYKAKVTVDAIENGVQNGATLTYSNDPKDSASTDTTPEQTVELYSITLNVIKYDRDSASNPTLAGAKFYLYRFTSEDSTKPYYYKAITNESGELTDIKWVSNKSEATYYVTGEDGQVTFAGIDASKDYYLLEDEPPAGYNSLTKPITIAITSESDDDGTLQKDKNGDFIAPVVRVSDLPGMGTASYTDTYKEGTFTYEIKVGNSGGSVLPGTGGLGAYGIYAFGAAVVLVAAVLIVRSRRREEARESL